MKFAQIAVMVALAGAPAAASDVRYGSHQFFRAPDYRDFDEWEDAWLNAQMRFVDGKTGWIVTNGPVFRSTDGGASWTALEGWNPLSAGSVWFLDDKHGWMLDATGPLLRTEDGGSSWTQASPPYDEWRKPGFRYPPDLFRFKDLKNGWGWDAPDLLRTRDGGRTWKKIAALPADEEVTDICFDSGGGVFAAGLMTAEGGLAANGMFVRRVSTGAAVSILRYPLKEQMDIGFGAECFQKAGRLWAAAPEGSAYSSADAGAHWTDLHLLNKGLLRVEDGGGQWTLGESLYYLAPFSLGGDRISEVKDDGAAALSFTIQGGKRKALFLDGHTLVTYDLE